MTPRQKTVVIKKGQAILETWSALPATHHRIIELIKASENTMLSMMTDMRSLASSVVETHKDFGKEMVLLTKYLKKLRGSEEKPARTRKAGRA